MKRFILTVLLTGLVIVVGAFCQTIRPDDSYAKSLGGVGAPTYEAEDLVENLKFDTMINIDFNSMLVKSGSSALAITSAGVSPVSGVMVKLTSYGVEINSTLKSPVSFLLSGTLNGSLTVNSDSAYQLQLNNFHSEAVEGPAFNLQSKQRAYIVLVNNSSNSLSDTPNRIKELDLKAALYSKGRIIFSGTGELNIQANYKHGIFSADIVRVVSGKINLTVNARDGIRADNGFIFDDGKLTIIGTGTTLDNESKGIKVDGSEKAPGQGAVVINGGYITIDTIGKGITAGWKIDEDAKTATTTDDPKPDLIVNNGVIDITTTGQPYERRLADGSEVSCSPEGLEAKADLTINGGWINLKTTDDSINGGRSITINGGYIFAASSNNDAIDSNGSLSINGGVIVAIGAPAPEGPFDCDNNRFAITGGTIIGIGGTISQPTVQACTQNVLVAGGFTKGSLLGIKAKDGSTVLAYSLPAAAPTLLVSTPLLLNDTDYSIYSGGKISGGLEFNGLVIGNLKYSDGTALKTFTTSTTVSQIGGQIFGGGPAGINQRGGMDQRGGQFPDGQLPSGQWPFMPGEPGPGGQRFRGN